MAKPADFNTPYSPTWCPGCGNFGIWNSLKKALSVLELEPPNIAMVYGIGCSGNMNNFVNTYAFHAIHGRTLPVATGIKLANNKLQVIAVSGDGDGYGIGIAHLIHAVRRNLNLTYIVHNNMVYGLTTGQTSPTSGKGFVTKSTPGGAIEEAINPLALVLSAGATFVARGFAGDMPGLTELIKEAVRHRGFSLIDVFQPCVTFNHVNTYQWYKKRLYKLEEEGYKPDDKNHAFSKSQEWGERIPIGIFYRESRKTYEDELPALAQSSLVEQNIENIDITQALEEFA